MLKMFIAESTNLKFFIYSIDLFFFVKSLHKACDKSTNSSISQNLMMVHDTSVK